MKTKMKAKAIAPSNVAFIKYWGKSDESLRIPTNGSISMNLSNLETTTTVEFDSKLCEDIVYIDGKQNKSETVRVGEHLDRIRELAGIDYKATVVSKSSFPASTGLSSSASGFAALTVAACHAAGLSLVKRKLSALARLGSGSAARSVPDGFVEWLKGKSHDTSYARTLHPVCHWDLVDIVVVVSYKGKQTPTTLAQTAALDNPFFATRLKNIDKKIRLLKIALASRDFRRFGELVESEALELHSIMMTSRPYYIYLLPETLSLLHKIRALRRAGVSVYFTINTGHNVHILTKKKHVPYIKEKLRAMKIVKQIIVTQPAQGARIIS